MVTYKLNSKALHEKIVTEDVEFISEHQDEVKKAVDNRKVVFKGEVMAEQVSTEET